MPIYYLDGQVGDVSIYGGKPVSSTGRQFIEFNRFEHNDGRITYSNLIVLNNATTNTINVPGWDLGSAGDCTFGGNVNAQNLIVGLVGQLRN